MVALTQFPFLKKKYEGGYFTRILNRHFAPIVFFAVKAGIPINNLFEELLSLAFTDRVIALERYTPDFIYQKIYSEKLSYGLAKNDFLKLAPEEQFLIASLIIYLVRVGELNNDRRRQLNQLSTILYASRLVFKKRVQVVGVFGIKSNFCVVSARKYIKMDVDGIQSEYLKSFVRLYKLKEHRDWYLEISREYMDFILTIPERSDELVESTLKKMISRFYEQYKKDMVQYTHIVNQVISKQFRKSYPDH